MIARIQRQAIPRIASAAALALAASVVLSACSPEKALWQSGVQLPGVDKTMRVERLVTRGDYLDAILAGGDFVIGVYLPNNDACSTIFHEGVEVNYLEGAPGGMYKQDDWVCHSAGIGTLIEWRKRRPRPRNTGSIVERGRANYKVVYQDDEVTFLRGRFPLTGLLGFVGFDDTIAVVLNTPECEAPIGRTTSTMEYYPTGKKVFTLVSTQGQCLITGLITPFGHGRPATPAPSTDPANPPPAAGTTAPAPAEPAQSDRSSGSGDVPNLLDQFNRAAERCRNETYRAIKAEPDRAWTEQERDDMTRECLARAGFRRAS